MNWILCGNPNKLSQIQDGKDPDAFVKALEAFLGEKIAPECNLPPRHLG
jgi:hypothetical protein